VTGETHPHIYEEIANSVTHGVGLALAIAGGVVLIVLAAVRGTACHIVAVSIYAATLIALYTASTLYHALQGARVKRVFRILDHSSIYLLIAGTYTPFSLITLRGPWGWTLLGLVWSLSIAGILWKVWFVEHYGVVSTALYAGMGWLAVVAVRPLYHALHFGGMFWIAAGGLAYTAGIVFFASKRRYAHAVWHLFVLAGSICHYVAVMRYALPS
jgi:hemolysin III